MSGVDYRKRTPELPYYSDDDDPTDPDVPVDQQIRKQLGLDVDDDGYIFKIEPEWDEDPDDIDLDDFDIDDDDKDVDESYYLKNLREQIEVIKIINRVLR